MDEECENKQLDSLIEQFNEDQERYAELEFENDVEPLIKISKENTR